MDLIYADKTKTDVGVLKDYSFDLAFGSDENNFVLTVSTNNNVCEEDYIVYIENTEYGGIIDSIKVDTIRKNIQYKGRTFHGVLNSKILSPSAGSDYYIESGEANAILRRIISQRGLSELFTVSSENSGINITSYQFNRYVKAYDGISAMLASVNAKLHIEFTNGNVLISAKPIIEYVNDDLDSDRVGFQIEKTYNPVNHLICLGKGELKNRTVIHLYCDTNGNISQTQTITGINEVSSVFDYPNVESESDLIREGTKKLKELNGADKIEVNLNDTFEFDIGDLINATDVITGVSITRTVKKKIVTINSLIMKVNYKVGE